MPSHKGRCLQTIFEKRPVRIRPRRAQTLQDGKEKARQRREQSPLGHRHDPVSLTHQNKIKHGLTRSRTSIALITILGLLGYAIRILKTQYDRGDAKSLVALGLGKASPFTLIRGWALPQTGDGAIVATVLIANLPQLLLSLLYVLLNGLVTSLSLAAEWSRHAHARRALRVSHPRGAQRSTYFLQLPYRLGVPLLACAAGLHWLVSQSIFVAKVDGVDPTGVPQDVGWGSGAVTCGYSPLGIVVTVVAALVLVGFVGVLGARRLRPGMPMAGSCSVAIAAACHVPKGTSALLPVMWGVIPEVEEERDDGVKVGHCAFSNERVGIPIEGRLYS